MNRFYKIILISALAERGRLEFLLFSVYCIYMSLFCLLWAPLFYLFWRSVTGSHSYAGGIWAFLAGCAAAGMQYALGFIVEPNQFGLSRWLSGCVDIVVLPALFPLLVYLLLVALRIVREHADFANFAQLWLIPAALVRALSWGAQNDPVTLILVPVLWTAIAVGIPFFINLILHTRKLFAAPLGLGILVIFGASASSYWAFFSHKTTLGFILFFAASSPMLVSMVMAWNKE